MKKLLITMMLALVSTVAIGGNEQAAANDTKVWICMSENAYAYHRHEKCSGLGRCKCNKKQVTIAEAKRQGKSKPCRICYK